MRIQIIIFLFCYFCQDGYVSAYDYGEVDDGGVYFTGSEFQEIELAKVENAQYTDRAEPDLFVFPTDTDSDSHEPETRSQHRRTSTRDGNKVSGEFRELQPNGMVKVVAYNTDPKTGNIKTTVEYNVA